MNNIAHKDCFWFGVILSWTLTGLAVYMTWVVQATVPRFEQLLSNFGTKLPTFTEFVLSNYALGWFAPGFGLLACVYLLITHNTQNAYRKTAVTVAVLAFVAAYLWRDAVTLGVYLPIFNMGDVVG